MNIVKANKTHLDQLEALEIERFEDNYSRKMLENDLKNQNNCVWVLTDDDKIVGYIDVFHIFDEANLQRIAVFEKYEGLGCATRLLNYAEKYLIKNNISKIYLEVSETNLRAVNFYIKNGYKETNRRKDYYKDLSDAIIMWKFF